MKKLVLLFVAVVAMSFASCGQKTTTPAATSDSDSVAVVDDSLASDSDSVAAQGDSATAAQAPAAE